MLESLKNWFAELRRRKVVRVAIAYPVIAWLMIEVSTQTFEPMGLPTWTIKLVVVLVGLGYPLALGLAWAFDITPEGIKRATSSAPSESIAVLPFLDFSPSGDHAYFGNGMAEEIINALTRIEGLRVVSRTSSFKYKEATDARTIGNDLNVRHILEGSIRRNGDELRVTAQLISVEDGYHVWSDSFDREAKDVFAIQEEIAKSIVDVLQLKLTPSQKAALKRPSTCTIEAYDYYLRGLQFFHRFGRRDLQFARDMFNKAIEVCDAYAPAFAGLADVLSFTYLHVRADPEICREALAMSARALELDPESAEAHASRGLANTLSKDYAAAEASFRRAIQLDPGLYEAHYFHARSLVQQGRLADATKAFEKASKIRPDDYQVPLLVCGVYRGLGNEKKARQVAIRGLENARRHLESHPDDIRAMYLAAGAHLFIGERDKALALTDRVVELDATPDVFYNAACAYALAGLPDKALDCLERAELTTSNRDWITHDSDLESLHDHPRFKALLHSLQQQELAADSRGSDASPLSA